MELETKRFYRFLAPRPVVLITTVDEEGKINAAPFSFIMPVSMDPPLLAVAIGEKRDTLRNIRETKEFVVNIPPREILDALWICSKSHHDEEKELEAAGLMAMESVEVEPPSIRECIAWFECKLEHEKKHGDHVLVLSEVVYASVRDNLVKEDGTIKLKKAEVLMHVSGSKFAVAEKEITVDE